MMQLVRHIIEAIMSLSISKISAGWRTARLVICGALAGAALSACAPGPYGLVWEPRPSQQDYGYTQPAQAPVQQGHGVGGWPMEGNQPEPVFKDLVWKTSNNNRFTITPSLNGQYYITNTGVLLVCGKTKLDLFGYRMNCREGVYTDQGHQTVRPTGNEFTIRTLPGMNSISP